MNAERVKSVLVASYTPARALLLWSAAILVLVLTGLTIWFAPRVFNAIAHSFEASAKQTEDVTGNVASASARLDRIAEKIEGRVDRILDNAESATAHLDSASLEVEQRLPVIFNRFGSIGTEGGKLIAESRPLVTKNLTTLNTNQEALGRAIETLTTATVTLVNKYGLTADEATKAIALASKQTGLSLEALAKQISDPRWGLAADRLVAATGEANGILVDFRKGMNEVLVELPGIAKDIHKTTTNISRYSRISIVVSIISRLASAFIPGLLN